MAVVDFSNAIIKPQSAFNGHTPWARGNYYGVCDANNRVHIYDASGNTLNSSQYITPTFQVLTPTKVAIIISGSFASGITSGTKFYLGRGSGASAELFWEISNISFQAGDTFSFQLDFDLTIS